MFVYLVAYFLEVEGVIWVPVIFLSIVVLGFCTWEGGFIGIQTRNKRFQRFDAALKEGKHVLFVDIEEHNEGLLRDVVARHSAVVAAGDGPSVPNWYVGGQDKFKSFIKAMP